MFHRAKLAIGYVVIASVVTAALGGLYAQHGLVGLAAGGVLGALMAWAFALRIDEPVRAQKDQLRAQISRRVRAEEALRLADEITENMVEGVQLLRVGDGTILYTNPRLDSMFG